MADSTLARRYGPGKYSLRQRIRQTFYLLRNRLYRRLLRGKGGTLPNGVRWWLDLPRRPENDKHKSDLTLYFSDPRAGGIKTGGHHMLKHLRIHTVEAYYEEGLVEHARKMGLRNLEPAEPGDPDGFFVKWKRGE